MKTDRFDETIRQKLDSIQPAFNQSAWLTLRQTLLQHGIVSTGAAVGGLFSALTALTVAGLLGTTVYLYRSNADLHRQVQTLTQTVTRLDAQRPETTGTTTGTITTESASAQPASGGDGVVSAHEKPTASNPANLTSDERMALPKPVIEPVQNSENQAIKTVKSLVIDQKTRLANGPANTTALPEPAPALPENSHQPSANPVQESVTNSRRNATTQPAPELTVDLAIVSKSAVDRPVTRPATGSMDDKTVTIVSEKSANSISRSPRAGRRKMTLPKLAEPGPKQPSQNQPSSRQPAQNQPVADLILAKNTASLTTEPARATEPTMAFLDSRPVSTEPMKITSGIDRRVRRLRYIFPSTEAPAAVVHPESQRVTVSSKIRIGLSAEADGLRTGGGLYAETQLGTHWTLGLGLNRTSQSGGRYESDEDFNQSTRLNFRRDYTPGFDPRFDIHDIQISRQSWQVPVSVGYRLSFKNGFALTPTIGLSVAVSHQEQVTFSIQRGPRDMIPGSVNAPPSPIGWHSNVGLSVVGEKSWGHWTLQTAPYLSMPISTPNGPPTDSPYRPNKLATGLRLRILYGF